MKAGEKEEEGQRSLMKKVGGGEAGGAGGPTGRIVVGTEGRGGDLHCGHKSSDAIKLVMHKNLGAS